MKMQRKVVRSKFGRNVYLEIRVGKTQDLIEKRRWV